MANMQILFDYNNLAHRCLHVANLKRGADDNSWGLLTLMIFKGMYSFVRSTSELLDVGDKMDVVIALDSSSGYWRRDLYPPYKMDRQARRDSSDIDWGRAYGEFDRLADSIAHNTPWKVLRVPKCEADDIIYTLATRMPDVATIIHSADSDYLQLVSDDVSVFSPHAGEYVEFPKMCRVSGTEVYCESPAEYLVYAILTGQGGKDNVYNVKTPTDWDASEGKRKPGFGVAAATKLLKDRDNFVSSLQKAGLWENFLRNQRLIDMSFLPKEQQEAILQAYSEYAPAPANMSGLLRDNYWPSLEREKEDIEAYMALVAEGTMPALTAAELAGQPSGFDDGCEFEL